MIAGRQALGCGWGRVARRGPGSQQGPELGRQGRSCGRGGIAIIKFGQEVLGR